jgi:hypothetical protein
MSLILTLKVFSLIAFPDLAAWLPENIVPRPGGRARF